MFPTKEKDEKVDAALQETSKVLYVLLMKNLHYTLYTTTIHSSHLRYIAAQGPCEETTSLFWEMIWQEDVRLVVMLTNLVDQRVSR